MGELGLNDYHQDQLVQFLRFSRYQRDVRMRSVDGCFQELQKSRMSDSNYTRDEVLDLLASLKEVVAAELQTEILNCTHTSLLLLRQLCGQAEQWHLKLEVNISELENREMLDAVNEFERQQFDLSASKKKPTITVLKRLQPMGIDSAPLFQQEIERLKGHNERLKDRMKTVEKAAIAALEGQRYEAEALINQVKKANLADDKDKDNNSEELMQMEAEINMLKKEMDKNMKVNSETNVQLEEDLTGTKRKLLQIKEQLELAEKELEKKFSQTAAYKNMKQILTKKNKQLQELRVLLNQNNIALPDAPD